jgi:hypothetical protein
MTLKTFKKKAPSALAPTQWRAPFDEERSPLRVSFYDADPNRNGYQIIQVQRVDGSIHAHVVKQELADALAGKASPETIRGLRDAGKKDFGARFDPTDDEMISSLRECAEGLVNGKLYIEVNPIMRTTPDDPAGYTTVSLRLPYGRTFQLLRWLEDKTITNGLDADADWCVSGYELFHANILNQNCDFIGGAMELSQVQKTQYAGLFALPVEERNEQFRLTVLAEYNEYLDGVIHEIDASVVPGHFKEYLDHNQLFTAKWIAEQFVNRYDGNHEVAHVVKINPETGGVQTVLGDDAAADHVVKMGPEYVRAMIEGRLNPGSDAVQ